MSQVDKPNPGYQELVDAFSRLLVSGDHSDLTISCGGQTFKVHGLIICSRSDFFEAACKAGFKEAETRTIELKEDDPYMVWRMITYLYKLDYDDSQVFLPGGLSNEEVANTPLLVNVIMYTMGDKYGIGGLKKVAETKFDEAVTGLTSPLDFLLVVAEVYESTPEEDRGLRDVAVRHAILNHKGLAISKKFRAVVAKVPQFACDIIAWKSEKATKPVTRFLTQCRGCHKTTYGKIEKLRCEDCNFLKSASTLDNIWCLN